MQQPEEAHSVTDLNRDDEAAHQDCQRLSEVLPHSVPIPTIAQPPLSKAMTGPTLDEARNVVEQIVAQVRGSMPENLDLKASIILAEGNVSAEELMSS